MAGTVIGRTSEDALMSTMNKELPHPNCYWAEPGRLLAGEYPGSSSEEGARIKISALLEAGVSVFLDLTEPGEHTHLGALKPYAEILAELAELRGTRARYRRMSIRDRSVPEPVDAMADILDTIDAELAGGHMVYVHCWGGIGRTGTVVGCYFVRRGQDGETALSTLQQLWQGVEKVHRQPHSPETGAQRDFVRNWSRFDRAG